MLRYELPALLHCVDDSWVVSEILLSELLAACPPVQGRLRTQVDVRRALIKCCVGHIFKFRSLAGRGTMALPCVQRHQPSMTRSGDGFASAQGSLCGCLDATTIAPIGGMTLHLGRPCPRPVLWVKRAAGPVGLNATSSILPPTPGGSSRIVLRKASFALPP
jgi:hypothetical protein